ncbi:MAG: hypothetical protein PHE20_00595 [Patescibacteria group bacterium]|nr:hypothetical protein [Patescibacteria group bacterium]
MRIKHLLFLLLPLAALVLSSFLNSVKAADSDNIRGRAYNSTYGYISFNCLDDDGAGRFPFTFPFFFNLPPCDFSQHGVNLKADNNFEGMAWNPSLGFIDFSLNNPLDLPPDNYAFNSHCPTCTAANSCTACYNEADQRIYGWGQVVIGGRWLELNGSISPQTTMTNYTNPQPGIFSGYASTNYIPADDFGSISFNCSNDSSCYTDNYYVWLWRLELKEMSAPNWSFDDACNTGARKAVFKWLRRGGIQTAYRVIINTSNSTSTPVSFDSGKIVGDANQFSCPGPWCTGFTFNYNTSYYWWLQLWDENDQATDFFQFDTDATGVLTDNIDHNQANNPGNYKKTFTTYKHEFPSPYFSWDPLDIIVGSSTAFTSNSRYYTIASPNTNSQLCIDGVCGFSWSASDALATISSTSTATTTIIFGNNNNQSVYLSVTDPDAYTCSTSSPILSINYQLPIWKEVKAD